MAMSNFNVLTVSFSSDGSKASSELKQRPNLVVRPLLILSSSRRLEKHRSVLYRLSVTAGDYDMPSLIFQEKILEIISFGIRRSKLSKTSNRGPSNFKK